MNFGKDHTEQLLSKTMEYGSHLYAGGKEALDELGGQVKEGTHKFAQRVHDEPLPSLLIAIGIGVILSGWILSKLSKH